MTTQTSNSTADDRRPTGRRDAAADADHDDDIVTSVCTPRLETAPLNTRHSTMVFTEMVSASRRVYVRVLRVGGRPL